MLDEGFYACALEVLACTDSIASRLTLIRPLAAAPRKAEEASRLL
jgi:hypothetical protein